MESKFNDGKPSFLLFKNIRFLQKKSYLQRLSEEMKKSNAKIKYMICFGPFLTLHCILLGRKFHWWIIVKLSQCFFIKHNCWKEKSVIFFKIKAEICFLCRIFLRMRIKRFVFGAEEFQLPQSQFKTNCIFKYDFYHVTISKHFWKITFCFT